MAQTPSTMLPLGTKAPAFSLPEVVSGRTVRLSDFAPCEALVVMFICNHCPFVKHVRDELGKLARDYMPRGSGFIGISSNDVAEYPDDAPDKMKLEAMDAGWPFAYCFDESQEVAKAYAAACTPDFYVFDKQQRLAYRGQLDDSRPPRKRGGNNLPVTGRDLRSALDRLLSGQTPDEKQLPSIGCNIKWKPGNEPGYFAIPTT